MAHASIRCGLRPADFWDATPWETNALAEAYVALRKDDHRREAWFTAHKMYSCGTYKPGTRIKKLLEQLNSPIEKAKGMIEITSMEQMRKWEEERARVLEAKEKDKDDGGHDADSKV